MKGGKGYSRHSFLEEVVRTSWYSCAILQFPCRPLIQLLQLLVLIIKLCRHIPQDTVHLQES